jgi:hypothetical protein
MMNSPSEMVYDDDRSYIGEWAMALKEALF